MLKMSVEAVGVDIESGTPIILLKNEDRTGLLPIAVGIPEARAIIIAIQGTEPPRPISYDLLQRMLEGMRVALDRVIVNKLKDRVFYAQLKLYRGEDSFTVDSRPSDAIAVALRTGSPIYCSEEVAARAFVEEPRDEEREREKFREFLDDLHPEDFRDFDEG